LKYDRQLSSIDRGGMFGVLYIERSLPLIGPTRTERRRQCVAGGHSYLR
jgi:hypothetical protein